MGNKQERTSESLIIDRLLLESFKDTDLEFPFKEVTKMKLRFKDAENYFHSKFDYLVFFNNYIFHEGLSTLYENYISKIENFTKLKLQKNKKNEKNNNSSKIFYLFVDFDDENEAIDQGYDLEFDSLFSIVFEKLEIDNITFFSLINANKNYLKAFFEQFYESVYFYKTNRKFDSLYFLLPNSDFFIKNGNSILYLASKRDKMNKTDNKYKAKYGKIVFNSFYFRELVNVQYPYIESNEKLNVFLSNIHRVPLIKCIYKINLNVDDIGIFLSNYEKMCTIHGKLCQKTNCLQIYIYLDKNSDIDYNYNLGYLLKNFIKNQENSNFQENEQIIKILNYVSSKTEEPRNTLSKINKFIQMVISDSFSKSDKKRTLGLEYYEVYKYKARKTVSLDNKITITDILGPKTKVNSTDIIKNKNLDDSLENMNIKKKTIFYYKNEKIKYVWFASSKEIIKIKILLLKWIKENCLSLWLEENNKKIIFQYIFKYLYSSKNNLYYYSYKNHIDNQKSQIEFEKYFFE